jgi:hypothetical protein
MNLGLCVASWAALLAWLLGGSEGAGNLFAVWSWFIAVVFTVVVSVRPKRLTRGAPVPGASALGLPRKQHQPGGHVGLVWVLVGFRSGNVGVRDGCC